MNHAPFGLPKVLAARSPAWPLPRTGLTVAAALHDGRLLTVDVASGQVTELPASDNGPVEGLSFSPDSAWLAWSHPGPWPLRRLYMAKVADHEIVEVTDGRFSDTDPVFTADGLYLAFLSQRSFDPVYDAQSFDLSFPYGSRPYLVTLDAQTPSPFGPLPGGRPVSQDPSDGEKSDSSERTVVSVDPDALPSRVVGVPVPEGRYSRLRAVKDGLVWLREPVTGVLGESAPNLDDDAPRPSLERYDLRKREVTELTAELDWFTVSGDGTRLVVKDHDEVQVVPSESKEDDHSSAEVVTVDLSRARFQADPVALWRHAYAEAGRIMARDFWVPDMSGVDWDGVQAEYRPLLDRIRGANDFTDLLWEVVAELGTSHAYITKAGEDWHFSPGGSGPTAVGQLGADLTRDAAGRWIVDRILPGESSDPRARSPLEAPGVAVRPGDELTAVDGQPVDPVRGPWPLLAGTAGKPVELTVLPSFPGGPIPPDPPRDPRRGSRARSSWCRCATSAGCATRTGWPGGAPWSASSATGAWATCTSRTWWGRAGPTSTVTCAPRCCSAAWSWTCGGTAAGTSPSSWWRSWPAGSSPGRWAAGCSPSRTRTMLAAARWSR